MDKEELTKTLRRKAEHVLANLPYQFLTLKEISLEECAEGTHARIIYDDNLTSSSKQLEGTTSTKLELMGKEDISSFIFAFKNKVVEDIYNEHGLIYVDVHAKDIVAACPEYTTSHLKDFEDFTFRLTLDGISDAGSNKEIIFTSPMKKYFYDVPSTIRWKSWASRQYASGEVKKRSFDYSELVKGIYGESCPVTFPVFLLNLLIAEGVINV